APMTAPAEADSAAQVGPRSMRKRQCSQSCAPPSGHVDRSECPVVPATAHDRRTHRIVVRGPSSSRRRAAAGEIIYLRNRLTHHTTGPIVGAPPGSVLRGRTAPDHRLVRPLLPGYRARLLGPG